MNQREIVNTIRKLAAQSTCWLGVGCVAVKDGRIVVEAYNKVLPDPEICNRQGCVRKEKNLDGGSAVEDCFAIHAEINLLVTAAREGIELRGADVYVTCFPCAVCAKALVEVGVAQVFYLEDFLGRKGEMYFKAAGVITTRVSL